jgi:hypothetical protein
LIDGFRNYVIAAFLFLISSKSINMKNLKKFIKRSRFVSRPFQFPRVTPLSILTRQLPSSLAFITIIAGATIHANAAVIADLRGDYDTPSTAHTNGQTSAGRIPDTFGTGSWNFFARNTMAPGGTQTALVYDTSANDVRAANAYVYFRYALAAGHQQQQAHCGSSGNQPGGR